MFWNRKYRARRAEIRRNRPDVRPAWRQLRNEGAGASLAIAILFAVIAAAILLLRQDVTPYRPGQYISRAIHSRVAFTFQDTALLNRLREGARVAAPRVYSPNGEAWESLAEQLRLLPQRLEGKTPDTLPENQRRLFHLDAGAPFIVDDLDSAALTMLDQYGKDPRRKGYEAMVEDYLRPLRKLIVLKAEERQADLKRQDMLPIPRIQIDNATEKLTNTYALPSTELLQKLDEAAAVFPPELRMKLVAFSNNTLQPTHRLDETLTAAAQDQVAASVDPRQALMNYRAGQELPIKVGTLDDRDRKLLLAEHEAFIKGLDTRTQVQAQIGLAGFVALVTALLSGYIWYYQRRVVRNHARAIAIALLLLSMLLLAQLAAIGTGPLYFFGVAPTILVAMILTIAYDRRFATGISTFQAILVTLALNQGIGFLLVLLVGSFTCCYLMDEIRSRSKLIEVGGAAALAMMLATLVTGAMSLDPIEPLPFIGRNCLLAGAAGLAVGFIVLGILPFVEKAFRITTSMTLVELADASQPLLRRLAMEAPGTYSHSLQVATLAEAASEAIGANSLLCRVGSYYHDVGKINKADYFIENQADGPNRHLNLSPNVSLLIIIGHVKDGLELAREYNLPTSLFSFIQQHHGTTLVEYFYHRACTQKEGNEPTISDVQYRYPGPKPRSKEVAIIMLSDAVESAARAMSEPTAGRIETLVHELAMKRLLDGQFSDCDLTMRELEQIERAMTKTVVGIYHGRIAYPSMASISGPATATTTPTAPTAKTA